MGNKREGPQRTKREGEEMLEMGCWWGSIVGIHAAVGVMVVLYESGKVVEGAEAARLEGDEKQKRLHRHFRHLPRRSKFESR